MITMAAEQERCSTPPTLSLVLSIFKGENFVVRGNSGHRVFLRAKCADLKPEMALETGTTKLTSACSDPEFNSQLAWSLSRKQLKELRSNRSIIRVSCQAMDEKGSETEIGYVVMHIKDASSFGPGVDVDPTKAKIYPLLGTKDAWRSLQPKLHMILHLEELVTREINSNNNNKQNEPISSRQTSAAGERKSTEKSGHPVGDAAAKLSETRLQKHTDPESKFIWTVHEVEGYFQLGSPSSDDDLHILNITIVSASYLHTLWDGRSPRKSTDEYFWQIRYSACGCDIASEPCLLSLDDPSRRTFIGDKATARIRAGGGTFYDYLRETSLEFHIVRYTLGLNNEYTNEQVLGFCFLPLLDLSKPDVQEIKASLDVVSEWGTPMGLSHHEKPEVRVLFSLESVPNYFSVCDNLDGNANNISSDPAKVNGRPETSHRIPGTGTDNLNEDEHFDRDQIRPNQIKPKSPCASETRSDEFLPENLEINVEDNSNASNLRRLLEYEVRGNAKSGQKENPANLLLEPLSARKRDSDTHSITTDRGQIQQNRVESGSASSEESDFVNNKENLAKLIPEPGKFEITIILKNFWLKSSRLLTESFLVSYLHHPIGIVDPVESTAEPLCSNFTGVRQGFNLERNEFSKTVTIRRFSEVLLNDPLTVEFSKMEGENNKCFATAMVPFGRIFFAKGEGAPQNSRCFIDSVDILKTNNNAKIGTLFFDIRLRPDDTRSTSTSKTRQSAFFPVREIEHDLERNHNSPARYGIQSIDKATNEMREWSKTQAEIYRIQKEEKDAAYIKILSEEAAKRDSEREKQLSKRINELDKKEKELNKQRRQMNEKEESLNRLELEIKERLRELKVENENFYQHTDMNMKRLEESHKIKLEGLNSRIQNYQEENEKLRRKIALLEQKLDSKNAEIDNLIDQKREQPGSRIVARVSALEEENKILKSQLKEANTRKEQYKKQSMALSQKLSEFYEKRDQELLDVNENLRLQILATREHKELKKERKAVSGISEAIKALKKETLRPNNGERNDERRSTGNYSKDEEIRRLQAERRRLLQTGAYNQYDMVIKELENKMISLSQQQSQ